MTHVSKTKDVPSGGPLEFPCFLNGDRTFTMPPDALLPARNTMEPSLHMTLPPSLKSFDIPHILEAICSQLSKDDLMRCCVVSLPFYCRFNPWLWQNISRGFRNKAMFSLRGVNYIRDPDDSIKALFRNGHLVKRLELLAYPPRLSVFNSGFTLIPISADAPPPATATVSTLVSQFPVLQGASEKGVVSAPKLTEEKKFREICPNIHELLVEIADILGSGWARQEADIALQMIHRMQHLRHLDLKNFPIGLLSTVQNMANIFKPHGGLETVFINSPSDRITKEIVISILQNLPRNIRQFKLKTTVKNQESESTSVQSDWPVYHGLSKVVLEGAFIGSDESTLLPFLEWSCPNINQYIGPNSMDPRILVILKRANTAL